MVHSIYCDIHTYTVSIHVRSESMALRNEQAVSHIFAEFVAVVIKTFPYLSKDETKQKIIHLSPYFTDDNVFNTLFPVIYDNEIIKFQFQQIDLHSSYNNNYLQEIVVII